MIVFFELGSKWRVGMIVFFELGSKWFSAGTTPGAGGVVFCRDIAASAGGFITKKLDPLD